MYTNLPIFSFLCRSRLEAIYTDPDAPEGPTNDDAATAGGAEVGERACVLGTVRTTLYR